MERWNISLQEAKKIACISTVKIIYMIRKHIISKRDWNFLWSISRFYLLVFDTFALCSLWEKYIKYDVLYKENKFNIKYVLCVLLWNLQSNILLFFYIKYILLFSITTLLFVIDYYYFSYTWTIHSTFSNLKLHIFFRSKLTFLCWFLYLKIFIIRIFPIKIIKYPLLK